MREHQTAQAGRFLRRAGRLCLKEIPTHGQQDMARPGWWARWKLRRASAMLERVLMLEPACWSAMWFLGMINKRYREYGTALSWFEKAFRVAPAEPDTAREACCCALELGRHQPAIQYAEHAIKADPRDAGLKANLALALFLAGRLSEAERTIGLALTLDPSDPISRQLQELIEEFKRTGRPSPVTLAGLQEYLKGNGS